MHSLPQIALAFSICLFAVVSSSNTDGLIVTLTGSCTQSAMQLISSGTMIPFIEAVPRDLGNVPVCAMQPSSRFCSLSMTLVCVKNDGSQYNLYGYAQCTGPEPVLGLCVPDAALCPTAELQAQVTNWSVTNTLLQEYYAPGGFCSAGVPSECNLSTSYSYLKADCLDETPRFEEDSGAVAVFAVIMTLCALCCLRPLWTTLRYLKHVIVDLWLLDGAGPKSGASPKDSEEEGEAPAAHKAGFVRRLLLWFDLFENLSEFFAQRSRSTRVAAGVVNTQFFEGLRSIAMMFVVYGHSFFFPVQTGASNPSTAMAWLRTYGGVGIFPAELAVDTFFYLSGFLTFHLLLKHTEKVQEVKIKRLRAEVAAAGALESAEGMSMTEANPESEALINHSPNGYNNNGPPTQRGTHSDEDLTVPLRPIGPLDTLLLYLRRWLRMTPVVMLTLVTATWLLQYVPTHDVMYPTFRNQYTFQSCREAWWRQLLYINNLHDVAGWVHCMDWFWYLSCDFQMFVAAPIVLLPYYVHAKYGPWLWTGIAVTLIHTIVVLQNFYGSYLGSDGTYYDKSYLRASPYLYGGICAVLIRRSEVRAALVSPRTRMTLYLIATLLMVSSINVMWAAMRCYQGGPNDCTHRFFNFMNCWVTFAYGLGLLLISLPWCCGHGGGLCAFLSNGVFVVLSKLTFCMYMLHPIVIMMAIASGRNYPFFSPLLLYKEFAAVFGITAVSALALHVVAEVPFAKLNDALTR